MVGQELKYQKVIDWIKEEIDAGRLQPGQRLMSEQKMSEEFGLCRQTIRRAMQELVEQKIVVRVQGSGTYVGSVTSKIQRKKHMNIAVVSTFYESYIFPPILKGIERTLSKDGYAMQVSFTDNLIQNEANVLKMILKKDNIDGVIIEPSEGALPNPNIKYYKEIQDKHIPIIFFNDIYPAIQAPCVRIDDQIVARKATQLLIDAGHKKIAAIFKGDDGQGHRRYLGFLDAMEKAELIRNPNHIVWIDTAMQRGLKRLESYLLKRLEGCTGLVCYNDEVAMQMIDIFLKYGIRVPEDLSVVSIDDSDLSEICKVPFTSFPHPKEKLGEKVAENLLKIIDNPAIDGNYLFDSEATIRNSIQKI